MPSENPEEENILEEDDDSKAKRSKRRLNRGKYGFPQGILSLTC